MALDETRLSTDTGWQPSNSNKLSQSRTGITKRDALTARALACTHTRVHMRERTYAHTHTHAHTCTDKLCQYENLSVRISCSSIYSHHCFSRLLIVDDSTAVVGAVAVVVVAAAAAVTVVD